MARYEKPVSKKLLNPTEHRAISKLMRVHEPILDEMEKWKDQREKLETALIDQIEMIGKILEPYYNQTKDALGRLTEARVSIYPSNKKSKSGSRKNTHSYKSSQKKSSKKKGPTKKSSRSRKSGRR